jgi:hypothetical protein
MAFFYLINIIPINVLCWCSIYCKSIKIIIGICINIVTISKETFFIGFTMRFFIISIFGKTIFISSIYVISFIIKFRICFYIFFTFFFVPITINIKMEFIIYFSCRSMSALIIEAMRIIFRNFSFFILSITWVFI